ncbi:glycosyltransferase [Erwinia oleae]|uniref:glycosyltransferase n=1 Tax=Erwinia oleae TaxID=796334 RepID=UPI00055618D3|nr:glycosyltransferase [Erwinia oleae]
MSHYALIAPPLFSHQRAMEALALTLIARGHRITFIHQADAQSGLRDPRIAFHAVGATSHPPGSLARTLALAASPGGFSLFRLIDDMARTSDMLCRELPAALNRLAVDGMIVDQMEPAGGLVADALGLPFVSVACALPVNREPGLPLPVMPFSYDTGDRARQLYASSQRVYDWMMRGQRRVLNRHARGFGLAPRDGLHDCLSPLAQISQTIPALDFPRREQHLHHVGPLRRAGSASDARWPVDSSRPFVFASLGTLQGHRFKLFKTIAHACRRLDLQLLIAHCGGLDAAQADSLHASGARWVTDFADQPAVLAQAQAVITHGGLNTVTDAIAHQTPILALPIAFDQPGVAARVAWSGLGRRVSRFCSSDTLAHALDALLHDRRCRERLADARTQLAQAGGAARAADITERALSTTTSPLAEATP